MLPRWSKLRRGSEGGIAGGSGQGSISGVQGADEPAYRISSFAGGFRATNPAQGLHTRLDSSGVSVSSGMLRLGLRLRAVGYGTSLGAVGSVRPTAKANRVTYTRSGL